MIDKQLKLATLAVLATVLAPPGAHGQLRQYSVPGQLVQASIPAKEQIRDRLAEAPWVWGVVRVQPRFSLGDLVYSANVFDTGDADEQKSDLRGNISAGLEAYVPAGPDVVLSSFVRPSYAWWQKNEDLRRLNMSYGAAAFGFFNRLSTQLTARRSEQERPLNSELRIPVTTRQDRIGFDGSLKIRGPWRLFGSVAYVESRYPTARSLTDEVPNLDLLERDEEVLSLGLAYDVPGRFNVGLGWREVTSEFLDDSQVRSNRGDYPFVKISLPGNRLQISGEIGLRLLEFEAESGLEEKEEAIGTLRFTFLLATRTRLTFYGGRDIVYSAVDEASFFAGGRTGAGLTWGGRFRVRLFSEFGNDDYESAGGINLGRKDKGEAYGVLVSLPLRWGLDARLGVTETTIDSNFDEFDRSTTEFLSTVRLVIDLPDFPF